MPASSEQTFPGNSRTPAEARRFALAALDRHLAPGARPDLCDDVVLVVSELVTNAVRAGSSTVELGIRVERTRVVVSVADRGSGWPQERQADVHDAGGRGLALVSAMSATWGVRMAADGGKLVWSELNIS